MPELLFSGPVLGSLLVAAAAAFGVSVVTRFLPDKRRLESTMTKAERALEKVRKEIAEKEAAIVELQKEVEMLKPLHARLSDYHEQLTEIRLALERKEMEEEGADEDEDDPFGRRKRYKL